MYTFCVFLFFRGLKTLVSRGRFQNTVSMDPGTYYNTVCLQFLVINYDEKSHFYVF